MPLNDLRWWRWITCLTQKRITSVPLDHSKGLLQICVIVSIIDLLSCASVTFHQKFQSLKNALIYILVTVRNWRRKLRGERIPPKLSLSVHLKVCSFDSGIYILYEFGAEFPIGFDLDVLLYVLHIHRFYCKDYFSFLFYSLENLRNNCISSLLYILVEVIISKFLLGNFDFWLIYSFLINSLYFFCSFQWVSLSYLILGFLINTYELNPIYYSFFIISLQFLRLGNFSRVLSLLNTLNSDCSSFILSIFMNYFISAILLSKFCFYLLFFYFCIFFVDKI